MSFALRLALDGKVRSDRLAANYRAVLPRIPSQIVDWKQSRPFKEDSMKKHAAIVTLALACISIAMAQPSGEPKRQINADWNHQFQINTSTFKNGGTLPLSMALGPSNCPYVSGGGDMSPEVSWENAPRGTRSFVVTLYDVTASFTHWGMYNISPETKQLPENAGVSGSSYGEQVFNDFALGAEYDGPCPPNNLTPLSHDYVITVFALDTTLHLPSAPPNFPAFPEQLYRAMFGHILGSASIHGFFSSAQ
jgi:Raf kinase inhibitor-like YbhB/YbcL family protein